MTDTVNAPMLWAMHILGPDDMYPAPDLATAFKWCEYVNNELAPRTPDVLLVALPVLWDGTAEQHAKSLPEAIKGWTVPERPEAPKVEQEPVAWQRKAHFGKGWIYIGPENVDIGYETRPLYTHPAPASDELLSKIIGISDDDIEALRSAANLEYYAGIDKWGESLERIYRRLSSIAKRKGPQS